MMYGYGYDGFSWMWMLGMGFFMLLATIGVILLVVWLVRSAGGASAQRHHYVPQAQTDEALDIARKRYAAGEITKEQYDEIAANLRR